MQHKDLTRIAIRIAINSFWGRHYENVSNIDLRVFALLHLMVELPLNHEIGSIN